MCWLYDRSLACTLALPPGRGPHVRGLSRTWVEQNGRPEAPPFSFPVSRCRPVVKALEKVVFNPYTRKSANMGHPSRGQGLVGNRKSRGRNDRQHPKQS